MSRRPRLCPNVPKEAAKMQPHVPPRDGLKQHVSSCWLAAVLAVFHREGGWAAWPGRCAFGDAPSLAIRLRRVEVLLDRGLVHVFPGDDRRPGAVVLLDAGLVPRHVLVGEL